MSLISMDVPTLKINENDLQNLVSFIYKHEQLLKEFGAIKLQPTIECKFALKRRRTNMLLHPITEQILKIGKDEPIYHVQKVDNYLETSPQRNYSEIDESSFWSSISCSTTGRRQVNASYISNKSFFSQRSARLCFDIHRLPYQSLLKLGGSKLTRQIIPCLKRAHGPGAVFPLSCDKQRLFSINYHHEGGNHHWYIIPNRERNMLTKIINQQNSSFCIDHGKLFIDPTVLDKNNIRYHRIIQQPNQFVVLSAGTLAQSFTENASWTESISFALPSWIEEGHARISKSSCQCDIHENSILDTIDFNLFRHELIQKYINSHLNTKDNNKSFTLKDYNDIDMVTIPTPNSNETNSSNSEVVLSNYGTLSTPYQPILSYFESPTTSMITPSVSSHLLEEDKTNNNNLPIQYELLEEGTFDSISDWNSPNTFLNIDSISNKNQSDQNSEINQSDCTSLNINENLKNNLNIDNYFLTFDELMDLLPSTKDNVQSTHKQINLNDSKNHCKRNSINKDRSYYKNKDNKNILFVSGLRNDVTKIDIRKHFMGSRKVILKPYRTASHLKYAFIYHYTSQQAERNLQRKLDFHRLGSNCHVEYANSSSHSINSYQNYGKRKLTIARIPENVSEDDLKNLFINSYILKYCPARFIYQKSNTKIILGYAFILYDDEQQADYVMKHAHQYKINGRQLGISVYRQNK